MLIKFDQKVFFLLWIGLLFSMQSISAQAMPTLADYQWKKRLILLFAPQADYPLRQEQNELLRSDQPGLDDRDLLIFEVLPNEVLSATSEEAESAEKLRERYRVNSEDYMVLLIGKDGSEKLRSDGLVTLNELYTLIDAMPVRREEMRRKH